MKKMTLALIWRDCIITSIIVFTDCHLFSWKLKLVIMYSYQFKWYYNKNIYFALSFGLHPSRCIYPSRCPSLSSRLSLYLALTGSLCLFPSVYLFIQTHVWTTELSIHVHDGLRNVMSGNFVLYLREVPWAYTCHTNCHTHSNVLL